MEATHFNSVDYFIFAILAISILISFFRGFIREAISLVIWVLAAVFAFEFADSLSAHFLNDYIASSGLRYLASFATIFLMVLIVGALVNIILTTILDKAGIGSMDRLLGVFFGAARGILVVAIMLMFINLSNVQPVSAIGSSRLVPHFSGLVMWLNSFLPAQLKQFGDFLSKKALAVSNLQETPADNSNNLDKTESKYSDLAEEYQPVGNSE